VEEGELLRVADHDQRALLRADDVVDALAEVCARGDLGDRGEQHRVAPEVQLCTRARDADLRRPALAFSRLALLLHSFRAPLPSPAAASRLAARLASPLRSCQTARARSSGR